MRILLRNSYNSNEHYLDLLGSMAAKHNFALLDVFPRETEQEKKLFELLGYAYIGAGYDPEYKITKGPCKTIWYQNFNKKK